MAFVTSSPVQRNTHLVPAGLALLIAGISSALHVEVMGETWPLVWLPLVIVSLWPRQASPILSAGLLFLAGLWLDWTTLGAPGQWSFVFLMTYAILRPDQGDGSRGLSVAAVRFTLALMIALPAFVLSGRLIYGVWPDAPSLFRGVTVAVIALPVVAVLRDMLARRMMSDDY